MNDLISRQALREAMYHEAFETDTDMQRWDSGCWIRYKMFENALSSAPTIDALPVRHGVWKTHYVGDAKTPWGSDCSVCGEWLIIDRVVIIQKYNYCPNCGAKMDGERKD